MSESKKEGGIVQLVVVLGLITFVCALLLGVVNAITKDKIVQNGVDKRNAAMAEIIPGAAFEDLNVTVPAPDKNTPSITGVYKAAVDGKDAGYCVEVKPTSGFNGELTLIVGIAADGTISGVKVTKMAETPGLGAKSQDADWVAQYAGQAADGSLAVTKDGGTINAITGATITSRAVTLGVNTAAAYVANMG